uniref:Uncharacterized protein n=1 Tax=Timema cristinae TaxID=61476 RepID=A0A7R9CJZ8_TIMCR|nr:unnamed protein product [Timema cristinae]
MSHYRRCPSHAYQCSTGSCLPKLSLCNGVTECPDGSDESALSCPHLYTCHHHQENCNMTHTCGLGEWRCSSGQCVGPRDVCNGHPDCNDGSDETMDLCFDQVCPKNMFRCHYGGCINSNLTCNNEPDCSDWSDETPDMCGQNENGGGCSLPAPSAHARYVASNCPSCRPGAMVTQYQVLNYSCEAGHTLQGSVSVYCHNSVWVPRLPTCGPVSGAVTCPAIVSPRLTISCESHWGNRKGWLPCDSPLPVGTVARYQCRRYYQPDGSEHEDNTEAECLRSGHWSRELLRCKPECGHIGTEVTPLVVHGLSAPFGFYPWQSALYVLQAGNWSFWCGGSLLNENAVITAGHCVWKVSPGTLRVALGKYYRDFNKQQDFTQIRDVKEIVIQPAYQDLGGNYGSDIAVLLMASPIEFSPVVRPVCIDWELDHMSRDLADGNFGTRGGGTQGEGRKEKRENGMTRRIEQSRCNSWRNQELSSFYDNISILGPAMMQINLISCGFHQALTFKCLHYDHPMGQSSKLYSSGIMKGKLAALQVAGWGVNENDTFSDSLRSTQLEVVSDKKCLSEQPRDFKKYVTYTSFCAGYRNGTGVCNGDSGGGLVFHGPDPNSKWFLQGIVSVSPRRRGTSLCNPTYYTVFTKVGVYVRWLQSVLAPLEPPTLKNTTEGEALIQHLHF